MVTVQLCNRASQAVSLSIDSYYTIVQTRAISHQSLHSYYTPRSFTPELRQLLHTRAVSLQSLDSYYTQGPFHSRAYMPTTHQGHFTPELTCLLHTKAISLLVICLTKQCYKHTIFILISTYIPISTPPPPLFIELVLLNVPVFSSIEETVKSRFA